MVMLIQILIDFFKFQTEIIHRDLLSKFIIILQSGTGYFIQAFTLNSGNMCLSHRGKLASIP